MTEAEWLNCCRPYRMITSAVAWRSDRKARLFAAAACRSRLHAGTDRRCLALIDLAERHADGLAGADELAHARLLAETLDNDVCQCGRDPTGVSDTCYFLCQESGSAAAGIACTDIAGTSDAIRRGLDFFNRVDTELCELVREIWGSPFHPVRIDPAWLVWNGATVPRIARVIYDDRAFELVPVLADALEDSGCGDAAILNHCRQTALAGHGRHHHMRGCWLLDLVLGKA